MNNFIKKNVIPGKVSASGFVVWAACLLVFDSCLFGASLQGTLIIKEWKEAGGLQQRFTLIIWEILLVGK